LPGAWLNQADLGGASQAQREREAKDYWDGLTLEQEAWVLRKMGFFKMGTRPKPIV